MWAHLRHVYQRHAMLIQEIVAGSQTAFTVISSRARTAERSRETRDNNNSCLNWMSAASSQVSLQRMSDSKYLEIAVTPYRYRMNSTTLSCNLSLLLEQIFDAGNTLQMQRAQLCINVCGSTHHASANI